MFLLLGQRETGYSNWGLLLNCNGFLVIPSPGNCEVGNRCLSFSLKLTPLYQVDLQTVFSSRVYASKSMTMIEPDGTDLPAFTQDIQATARQSLMIECSSHPSRGAPPGVGNQLVGSSSQLGGDRCKYTTPTSKPISLSQRMCGYSLVERLSKGWNPLHEPHKLFHSKYLLWLDFLYINFRRVLA